MQGVFCLTSEERLKCFYLICVVWHGCSLNTNGCFVYINVIVLWPWHRHMHSFHIHTFFSVPGKLKHVNTLNKWSTKYSSPHSLWFLLQFLVYICLLSSTVADKKIKWQALTVSSDCQLKLLKSWMDTVISSKDEHPYFKTSASFSVVCILFIYLFILASLGSSEQAVKSTLIIYRLIKLIWLMC